MRVTRLLLLGLLVISAGWLSACQAINAVVGNTQEFASQRIQRGDIDVEVEATGQVRGAQSAILLWRSPGVVASVNVEAGERVSKDQVLAVLEQSSLPASLILAQAERAEAQKALDELQRSQLQSARALQNLEQAEQALQDAQNPALIQAQALQDVAQARQAVDDAEQKLAIVKSRPSQMAIDQAYSNMLLAENVLKNTQREIDRAQKKLDKDPRNYFFFESRKLYRRILKSLEIRRAGEQVKYEEAVEKYQRMQEPIDPLDLAEAEANLAVAQANLEAAEREYQRRKDGYSSGKIAVLEAELDDALREWERVKDGPDPADILAAEARLEAAEAALTMDRITAPFSGIITQALVQPGDQVNYGLQAFRLDDLSRLLVDVDISEIDINRIQVGQSVRLTFEAVSPAILHTDEDISQPLQGASPEYQGQVVQVREFGQKVQGVTRYQVTVEIDNPDQWIKPGITAETKFITQRLEDVLRVPNTAIRFVEGERVVYVMRGGGAEPVKITTGASSQEYTQVLSGDLVEGDLLLTDPPDDILASR